MSNNTNASDGFDSSDSILSESNQSCQDLSKSTQTCQKLAAAINKFPQEWALTPCIGKRNLWPAWQKTKLNRAQLIEAIRSQKNHEGKHCAWTGVSIVTGPLSNGVMAIDFDGHLALTKYLELSGGPFPPSTKQWTSGKQGHFQILLSVPPEKWEGLKPQKIELDGGQKLELRWNQCSTLPPSIHPDTQSPYLWKNRGEVAECPDFILDLMKDAPTVELPQKPKPEHPTYIDAGDKSLVDLLESEILPRLDAEEFYGSYLKLKSAGKNLKALCPFHEEKTPSFSVTPAEKTFHCFGCGVGGGPVQFIYQLRGGSGSPTGKDFTEVVRELADRVGVKIGDRKFKQNPESKIQNLKSNNVPQPLATNVVRPPQFQVPPISELAGEIEKLFDSDLKKSQLQLKISELAQKYRVNSADVWKIYREREQELEQELDQENTATEVTQLLASQSATLNLTAIFPSELAEGITRLAQTLNIKPECYGLALLTQVSTLLKPGTRTMLYPQTNFRVCPNFFAAMIAESSQKKTPIIRAIITDPMEKLNEVSRKAFEEAKATYEEELNAWKASKDEDKGPKPQEPARKVYYITAATGESIPKQAARRPDQALLWVADELAGMLKSPNQYRGGKGSDEENLLEYWSGGGAAVLRADGLAVDAPNVGLSIFGNIQPKVLAQFLGDGSDDNGKFARFELIQQPLAATELFEDAPTVDLTPMLSALYGHLDTLPPQNFKLDAAARKLFIAYYNQCELDRVKSIKQGMRAMLGKAPEKVGKIATILHAIHGAFKGGEISENISAEIVRAAIQFVKYTTDQALSVNLDICESSALAPNLAKIISLAERSGGTTTVAKIAKSYNAKLRPDSQKIRAWLDQLVEMKYGEVTSNGRNISFTLSPRPHSSPLTSNPYIESLESVPITSVSASPKSPLEATNGDEWGRNGDARVPILESLPSKALSVKGDYGDAKKQFSKKSSPLLPSCTTEPTEFTDEHHAKILADKMREAITSSNFESAKEIVKQVNVSTSQLRASFWQNLDRTEEKNKARLLAFANLSEGTPIKYVGKIEQYAQENLTAYDADGHGHITCLLADGRGFTTWIPIRDLRKL
jgi:hypothetical protein